MKLFIFALLFAPAVLADGFTQANSLMNDFPALKLNANGSLSAEPGTWSQKQSTDAGNSITTYSHTGVIGMQTGTVKTIRSGNALKEIYGIGSSISKRELGEFFHATVENGAVASVTQCQEIGECYSVDTHFCAKVVQAMGGGSVQQIQQKVAACFNLPSELKGDALSKLQTESNVAQARMKELGGAQSRINQIASWFKGLEGAAGTPLDTKSDQSKMQLRGQAYLKTIQLCGMVDQKAVQSASAGTGRRVQSVDSE